MISLVEGRPGQGKTLFGCDLVFKHLSRRKTFVGTNVDIIFDDDDARKKRFKQLSVASTIEDIRELDMYNIYKPEWEGGMGCDKIVLVIDEVQTIMNSRRWAELPPEFEYFLQQHRHYKFDIIGLTQSVKRADPVMRELIQVWYRIGKIFTLRLKYPVYGVKRKYNKKVDAYVEVQGIVWKPLVSFGFFYLVQYDPESMESQTRKYDRIGWPMLFFASPFVCRMYDTYQKFPSMSRKGKREIQTVVYEEKTTITPRVLRREIQSVDNSVAQSDALFNM